MFETDKWAFTGLDGQISLDKWQKIIDLIAELFSAPSGYIVQATSIGYRVVIRKNEGGSTFETNPTIPPESDMFCRHVVESDNLLYVNDAASTEMWSAMPEVVENGVNSYLGLPIHWPQGDVFGTLCLKDNKETNYTNEYFELINQLRDLIEDDLALVYNFEKMREIAMLDPLTNIYNRRALSLLAQQKLNLSHRLGFDVCCLFIDINDIDVSHYVKNGQALLAQKLDLPAGYSVTWAGQYEYIERAKDKLKYVVPLTLAIIILLLYLNFKRLA